MKELCYVHIPKCGGTSVKKSLDVNTGHQTLLSIYNSLSKEEFNRKFTFSFVRNPFDRFSSFYKFLRKHQVHGVDNHLSFENWLYLVFDQKDPIYRYREEYFQPAFNWLTISGNEIEADFVGRIERKEDFERLCKTLKVNTSLPKLNTTSGEVQYSNSAISMMLEIFSKDFKLWYPQELELRC